MSRALVFLAVLGCCIPETWASPHSDSLVAFVGDHAKFVWRRRVVCNENYQPVTPVTRLMLLDTREGTERTLVEGGTFNYIRISRSGKWVTWNNNASQTLICDLAAASPQARVILDKANCTYWCSRAMWVDPSTGTEYLFCLDKYGPVPFNNTLTHGQGIYKVPLTSGGTADLGRAQKLTINFPGEAYVDDVISLSADGKKLGGAFPWPDTYILDIATGRLDLRHEPGFGCQANLAPDNSYRFFHCEGDHFGIFMFAANMVDQHWYINLSRNLDGFGTRDGMDFAAPRWSNHAQFLSNTFPMADNWDAYDESYYAGKDAAWVKANVDILHVPQFVLQKFTVDFKGIEKSKLIASDIRYLQWGGDAWLANGVTTGATQAAKPVRATPAPGLRLLRDAAGVTVDPGIGSGGTLRVIASDGRLVRQQPVDGAVRLETGKLDAGIYAVRVTRGSTVLTQWLSIAQ